ncbi:sensor histidine kinase [Nocardioides jejuensis]|uniref:histidine kinase n=1 Tax=Nocardioides jejuensis TaxID=2502782 RepID=A0A4R1CGZ5_9ACTN|nr:histidine kinase [Nocardioides jejuensis]TCJ30007.1 histidine kinase [Nocardioides jejuensis]
MSVEYPARPLTRRSHIWRYALCLVISAIGWGSVFDNQWDHHRGLWWLDLAVGSLAYVAVFYRRRNPLATALLLNAAAAVSGFAAGPAVLAAVSLASRRVYREIVLVGLVSFSAGITFTKIEPQQHQDTWWLDIVVNLVATVAILGWGLYIGSRRELVARLHAEVAQAAAEQELRADQARGAERSRIAREMHDVLAHRISQISMRANAVMFREDLSAEQLREQVGVIQANANEALADLRSVLGVLRDPASGAPLDRPQPTFGDLASLVADEIAAGASVTLTTDVEGDVPELAGRTAYRIVQEALTNSRKHAPGAAVTVAMTGAPRDGLTLLIRNPLGFASSGTPGSGLGLVGLRERAELAGGRLDAGREMSSWVIRGWIPWEK